MNVGTSLGSPADDRGKDQEELDRIEDAVRHHAGEDVLSHLEDPTEYDRYREDTDEHERQTVGRVARHEEQARDQDAAPRLEKRPEERFLDDRRREDQHEALGDRELDDPADDLGDLLAARLDGGGIEAAEGGPDERHD